MLGHNHDVGNGSLFALFLSTNVHLRLEPVAGAETEEDDEFKTGLFEWYLSAHDLVGLEGRRKFLRYGISKKGCSMFSVCKRHDCSAGQTLLVSYQHLVLLGKHAGHVMRVHLLCILRGCLKQTGCISLRGATK